MFEPSPISQLTPKTRSAYATLPGITQPYPAAKVVEDTLSDSTSFISFEHKPFLQLANPAYSAKPYSPSEANEALLQSLKALPDAIGAAVQQANAPMKELLFLAKDAVAERTPTRMQRIAAAINRWALPIAQVLLGAAILAVGIHTMEISIVVIGATMTTTGLAMCMTLLAGTLAPHPLDAMKEFLHRRHKHAPDLYEPPSGTALDAAG